MIGFTARNSEDAEVQHRGEASKAEESTVRGENLSFTGRIAAWSARRRWWVLAGSVMTIVLAMVVLSTVETKLYDGDGGEGDSVAGAELIDERFENDSRPTEQVVFHAANLDANSPEYRATVDTLIERLRALPEVESAESYYDTQDPAMVSENGRAVLAEVVIDTKDGSASDNVHAIVDAVREADKSAGDFEIGVAGNESLTQEIEEIVERDFATIMLVTLVLGLGILLIAFRAVVAATIPLTLALGAIFSATAVAAVVSQVVPLADSYSEMILLMGMAVGIDYSLFIVSRFRAERKVGRSKLDAIAVASNTTGRAVLYAGITVVLSLSGLMLTDNPIFISLSLAAIIVVALAIVGSLTLLPALLSALGDNVNRLRLPIIGRDSRADNGSVWAAIADKVLARPAVFATITATALVALALPVASLNLGFNSGAEAIPKSAEGRRAVELIEEYFATGVLAPAVVAIAAADVQANDVTSRVDELINTVGTDDAFVGPFQQRANKAGDAMVVLVPTVGGDDDKQSETAVNHLRDIVAATFSGSDADVYVTGQSAGSLDFKNHMYATAPYVFGFVLGLAFVLMTVMFRSIVIPVKAIILNLLSVGAAYGVMVVVFQWGWGVGLLGAEATGVIEAWLPLFLFGILFGLSMDYNMLLLNRVKEAHDSGQTTEDAVATGIKLTAGQITSAAAIMVGVFGAFALGSIVGLQQFGLGLGVAVLIDATVIRSVLLPATMKLLGDANWYLPSLVSRK